MKRFLCCIKGGPSTPQPPEYDEDELITAPNLALSGGSSYPVCLDWEDVVEGTENFLESNILGQGSYGKVYRCNLPFLNTVGAAKIEKMHYQLFRNEFVAEVAALHAANHPNVIKLLGRVEGEEHRALVYELVGHRSVDKFLYGRANLGPFQPSGSTSTVRATPSLDWAARMKIALGVADALIYVHRTLKLIHRDIKASNILLDDDFVPKLTDFGLATRVVYNADGDEVPHVVRQNKGTPGCAAPEAEMFGTISTKSDVYSYGAFLLTLFTGRKPYDMDRPDGSKNIAEWVKQIYNRKDIMTLVLDYSLGQRFSVDGFERLFLAIRMCIDSKFEQRPNMEHVRSIIAQAAAHPTTEVPSAVFSRRSV